MIIIPGEHQERLEAELTRLKSMFHRGHSLTVRHLPGKIRYSENGKVLAGEVQGTCILLYESKEEAVVQTLFHEYVEAIYVVPMLKHCYDIMKHQQEMLKQKEQMLMVKDEIIHKLLMQVKENVVDSLSIPICKMMNEA